MKHKNTYCTVQTLFNSHPPTYPAYPKKSAGQLAMTLPQVAEFAFDLHSGLASQKTAEFEHLTHVGMAATVAVHIKGLGQIDYDVLRAVSDHFMGVPSYSLQYVLEALEQIDFVKLVKSGKKILKVEPRIPPFERVYDRIGEYANSECDFNEHEQATLQILRHLQNAPFNRDALFNKLGMEKSVFDRCMTIGSQSGVVSQHKARGKNIVISPYYFSDNLRALADLAASSGAGSIKSTIEKIKKNQGWPLSLASSQGEIGGVKLDKVEVDIVKKLASEGIVRPPMIRFGKAAERFLFTPKPGSSRLNAANREIYERAMALVSAVRKGQLLADQYKIKWPMAILTSLRDKGYLRPSSEAQLQYQNLVFLRVGTLKQVSFGRWEFHLNPTDENKTALNLAISLLQTGELANMEVDEEARIALTKDETYVQSLISASDMKKREKQFLSEEAVHEYEQLLYKSTES